MVAPFPPAARLGNDPTLIAREVYGNFKFIGVLSDNIGTEPEVNLKKLAFLAFKHTVLFASQYDNPSLELRRAVYERMQAEGVEWQNVAQMHGDLEAIRAEGLLLSAYVDVNMPEALVWEERTFVKAGNVWNEVAIAKTIAKPHPVEAEVVKLRALYGVRA